MKNKAGAVIFKLFSAGSDGNLPDIFYQSIRPAGSGFLEGRNQRAVLFDIRKPWYSWGLHALWNSGVSKFCKVFTKTSN